MKKTNKYANKTVTINGKVYPLKNIDFNAICTLEELGVDFTHIEKQGFTGIRGLAAFVMGVSKEEAGAAIFEHVRNGGSVDDLKPLLEMVTESDFFRH